MFTYSKKLREECIIFFKEECDHNINHETADLYLERLGDFYRAMENIINNSETYGNRK